MEFTIDFAAVRKITSQEYAQAHREIAALGVLPAYRLSAQRHDARIAGAGDVASLACKAGCSWCCYFSVDVRPVEVFNILDFIERELSPPQTQRLFAEIEANSAVLKDLDDLQRMQHNVKCPFLQAGRCSIYAARPQTCRNYHATSATGCQQSFEQPDNLDIEPEYAPLVYQAGVSHVDAFSKAMRDAGYDIAAYELNAALALALSQPETRQRFETKLPAFTQIEGTAVPFELMDDDE